MTENGPGDDRAKKLGDDVRIHRCDHCGTRRPRTIRAIELHQRAHHYDLLRERLSVTRLAPVIPLHRAA